MYPKLYTCRKCFVREHPVDRYLLIFYPSCVDYMLTFCLDEENYDLYLYLY